MTTHPSTPEAQAQVARTCVVRFFQTLKPENGPLNELPPVLAKLRTAALAAGLLGALGAHPGPAHAGDPASQLRLRVVAAAAMQGLVADRSGLLLDLELAEAAGRAQAALLDKGPGSSSGWASRDRAIEAKTGYVASARMPVVTWRKEFRESAVPDARPGEECAVLVTAFTGFPGGKPADIATLFCRGREGWRLVDMGDWARVYESLRDAGAEMRNAAASPAPVHTGESGEPCLETSEEIQVGGRTETAFGIACRMPS